MKSKKFAKFSIALLIFLLPQTQLQAASSVNLTTGTIITGGSPGTINTSSGLQFTVTSPDNYSCNTFYENITNVFDGNPGSKYCYYSWYRGAIPNEVVLHYLNGSVNVTSLGLTSANDAERRDPKAWQLFGSTDGVNWTSIATNTYSGSWYESLGRYSDYQNVNFASANYFSYIKFVVTDIRDLNLSSIADSGGPIVQYSELRLFGLISPNCDYKGNSGNANNSVGSSKANGAATLKSKGLGGCQNASSR